MWSFDCFKRHNCPRHSSLFLLFSASDQFVRKAKHVTYTSRKHGHTHTSTYSNDGRRQHVNHWDQNLASVTANNNHHDKYVDNTFDSFLPVFHYMTQITAGIMGRERSPASFAINAGVTSLSSQSVALV